MVIFALLTICLILFGFFLSLVLLGAMIGSSFYRRPKLKPPAALPKLPQREERPLALN
jgi:hypothetical protein